ncbi:hypothetical protein GCM10027578_05550 [Spirosoma luteolum]
MSINKLFANFEGLTLSKDQMREVKGGGNWSGTCTCGNGTQYNVINTDESDRQFFGDYYCGQGGSYNCVRDTNQP